LLWVIPKEFIHAPKCGELTKKLKKSNQSKHQDLRENSKREKPQRGFHYTSREITMVIAPISHARISGFN